MQTGSKRTSAAHLTWWQTNNRRGPEVRRARGSKVGWFPLRQNFSYFRRNTLKERIYQSWALLDTAVDAMPTFLTRKDFPLLTKSLIEICFIYFFHPSIDISRLLHPKLRYITLWTASFGSSEIPRSAPLKGLALKVWLPSIVRPSGVPMMVRGTPPGD